MKERLTSVDVAALQEELNQLKGAKIEKTYQLTRDEILIKMYHYDQGNVNLIIESGKRMHLTDYPRPAPERPPDFPMVVRKHTKGGTLKEFKQFDFDRITVIEIERGEEEFKLISELFGKGNVILTRRDGAIINSLRREERKKRKIKKGQKYEFPSSKDNPLQVEKERFRKVLKSSDSDVVRTLATRLNIGGTYAEEICERSGIDKNKEIDELTEEEMALLFDVMKELFNPIKEGKTHPRIVEEGNEMIDVTPLKLEVYSDKKQTEFDSLNKALDEYFNVKEVDKVEEKKESKFNEELKALEGRKHSQLSTAREYEEKYEEGIEKGDLIYGYFNKLEKLLDIVRKAQDKYGWEEVKEKIEEGKKKNLDLANMVEEIKENKGEIEVKLDEKIVSLDITKSIPENAKETYEKAKKLKRKSKGARKAAKDTEKKIKELKEKGKKSIDVRETPQRKINQKSSWYDKYRWFKSTDGFLVIGGRNADQNEEIVKKHMQSQDLFFHTEMEGAPAVILKTEGKDVHERNLREAAKFAGSTSQAWKKFYSTDVYYVNPDQVTKNPESGEFIKKGSFVIRGNRNYFNNMELEHSVGLEIDEYTRVIGGPPEAIKSNSKYQVELEPGDEERSQVAKKIKEIFEERSEPEEKKIMEKVATTDEIERFFPPGKLRIKEKN
ncbi:MAG: Ribosome quality control (RQC) complex component, YloA/Tae2 family [Candidatus Methanohalarchaeum thermophilum]|uniref:Ribosome quality control (RQC) complex component, YloA/Tae2 family n=1 Tax=Methanohalarchaeum thermophilum TaxID=1903181 RepID=A0A1Q6DWY5_METT1|nr:MAG: Ribosome quality control (RQC) complex component, YloA/Tae2 family [Candidatus Methanohalarchaeum thermophilum]